MELELRDLLGYARRWWWLLVLLPILTGGLVHFQLSRQAPLYSAAATLLIQPAPQGGNTTDLGALQSGQRLAGTYQQLVVTEPVLRPVAERLGAPFTVELLRSTVSASTVRDTQLLRISVSDTDPTRAADIANHVASEFQRFIANQERANTGTAQAGLQRLIDGTQAQRDEVQRQVDELEGGGSLDADGEAQLDGSRTRLGRLEQSLAALLVQQQTVVLEADALQNQVRVYVPATPPSGPYAPRMLFYTVLGVFLGGLLAVGTVGLIEYLDNTVKPSLDFLAQFGTPLMSVIRTMPSLKVGKDQVFILAHPFSSSAEALRLLRANLEFAAASREICTMMVSSALPGEGKSTVTANLAVAMSQGGLTVIVIDADLRRPTQHRLFGLANQTGLTTLLTHPHMAWDTAATDVAPGLRVIPSGPLPPNPADLLSTDRFRSLLSQVQEQADLVLVDTPPVLAVSDPLVVSTLTDGVLLVSKANHTRIDVLRRAVDAFPDAVRLIGVALNQQDGRGNSDYYYNGYYGADVREKPVPAGPGKTEGDLVARETIAVR